MLRERIRLDLQQKSLMRPGLDTKRNIKLGEGGIREIEFVVQLSQLIKGGRMPALQQRGLLEDTLVWWGAEFGRTPYAEKNGTGRDHNPGGFTTWLAGGGVKPGFAYGATDEFGHLAIENKVHMHDLHATILALLGLDHEKLTYRYSGRDFRLTDVHGRVVPEIVA
jgi:hypothetical protein